MRLAVLAQAHIDAVFDDLGRQVAAAGPVTPLTKHASLEVRGRRAGYAEGLRQDAAVDRSEAVRRRQT